MDSWDGWEAYHKGEGGPIIGGPKKNPIDISQFGKLSPSSTHLANGP